MTYVSRGFESIRGFDIFMKVAKRIYTAFPDVIFLVVGADRIAYGGDLKHIKEKSYLAHVLKQDDYDLSRFVFPGLVKPNELAKLLSISDLHLYFTAPFVLSWSLFNALACGCTVVASDTGPVAEVVRHEENGLLADFYDVAGLADLSLRVLRDPEGHRHLGRAGMELIGEKYALSQTLPRLLEFYQGVHRGRFDSGSNCAERSTSEAKYYPLGVITGQRRAEVAGMRWSEVRNLDASDALWEIPGERTKNKQSHLVPISPPVRKTIRGMPKVGDLVFTTTGETPVSGFGRAKEHVDSRICAIRETDGLANMSAWTLPDLRRTMVTVMNEHLGVAPHMVKRSSTT